MSETISNVKILSNIKEEILDDIANNTVQEVSDYNDVMTREDTIETNRDIHILYPSIISHVSVQGVTKDDMDVLVEVSRQSTIECIEDWHLPVPLSQEALLGYYKNATLDTLQEMYERFAVESERECLPLMRLLESWMQCVSRVGTIRERMSMARDKCNGRGNSLWQLESKKSVQEGRCGDNVVVRRSYSYDEAVFDVCGGELLEECVRTVAREMEVMVECEYEHRMSEALIETYLARVVDAKDHSQLREALATLFRFLRRPLTDSSCYSCLHKWILFLGADVEDHDDRLYMMWLILHAPAGVGAWATRISEQSDVHLSMTCMAMLLAMEGGRGDDEDDLTWTMVDYDGEEASAGGGPILSQSDIMSLLDHVHLKNIFTTLLAIEPGRYLHDPDIINHCGDHQSLILTILAVSDRLVDILSQGLRHYDLASFKTLNYTLSGIITQIVQFLTDFLESILGATHNGNLPRDTALFLLAQYELVFEHALLTLLGHPRHGVWQSLADLPWRLLSPDRKRSLLHRLLDPGQCVIVEPTIDQMISCLHTITNSVQDTEVTFLLSTFCNLTLHCRLSIATEKELILAIVQLLFNTCFIHPPTIGTLSILGRQLLTSICLKHHTLTLSLVLQAAQQWHTSIDHNILSLFQDLPFSIMLPSDSDFELLQSWIMDHSADSLCNKLARHVLAHLNWSYGNCHKTALYLPLSRHRQMANLLIHAYDKHDRQSWISDNTLNTAWITQVASQDQSLSQWCVTMITRLPLHRATRLLESRDNHSTTESMAMETWIHDINVSDKDTTMNPVATYIRGLDSKLPDLLSLETVASLIEDHKLYGLSLELIYNNLLMSTVTDLDNIADNDQFIKLWGRILHADDTTFSSIVKTIVEKPLQGTRLLSYIGQSLCSLVLASGDRQDSMMKCLLRLVLQQNHWVKDHSCLGLLDTLLALDTALHCKAGASEMYKVAKDFTDKQLQDASKKSVLSQLFRSNIIFHTLLDELAVGDYLWVKSYILEAQSTIEDDLKIWPMFLGKLLAPGKKKSHQTVTGAMASACKQLKWALTFDYWKLTLLLAPELLLDCPFSNFAFIKIATVMFAKYLGLASLWDDSIVEYGSAGHIIFRDGDLNSLMKDRFQAFKAKITQQVTDMQQKKDNDLEHQNELEKVCNILETFILWIDEPQLHMSTFNIAELPSQYRPDLLARLRSGHISTGDLNFPSKIIVSQSRASARLWTSRNEPDLRTFHLSCNKAQVISSVTMDTGILHRFTEDISHHVPLEMRPSDMYRCPETSPQTLCDSDSMLALVSVPLNEVYRCADKFSHNRQLLQDLDYRYLEAIRHYYEPCTISVVDLIPCHKGRYCSQEASIPLEYVTWTMRANVESEIVNNRHQHKQLLDDMLDTIGLEMVVKSVLCLHYVITDMDHRLHQCTDGYSNEDDVQALVQCGMTLFFLIGHRIDIHAQCYPPHRYMVSRCLQSLGTILSAHMGHYAQRLLQCMLEKEHLVEMYGPHFNPNIDYTNTPAMYAQVVTAVRGRSCSLDTASMILSKFDMNEFMACGPRLPILVSMVSTLCDAMATRMAQCNGDNIIDVIHGENLVLVMRSHLDKCLSIVIDKYLKLCQDSMMAPQCWILLCRSIHDNIKQHRELSMSIEDIRRVLIVVGTWLHNTRWSDTICQKEGLYRRYGEQAEPIIRFCSSMLSSLLFKTCRAAKEDIVPWHEVIGTGWDFIVNIYGPWLQALSSSTRCESQGGLSLPWRPQDKETACVVAELLVEQVNEFMGMITDIQSHRVLLQHLLQWILDQLSSPRGLQTSEHHDVYRSSMAHIHWDMLVPTNETVTLIIEFFTRSYNSDQSMEWVVIVCSRMCWGQIVSGNDGGRLMGRVLDMLVAMVCKTMSIFKMEAMECLIDGLMILHWDHLSVSDYRRAMAQLCDHLSPRVVLMNVSTIEGKLIKLLGDAGGQISCGGTDDSQIIEKKAIYINMVVTLLVGTFSSVNYDESGGINASQVRVLNLLEEIETMVAAVTNAKIREQLAGAMILETMVLYSHSEVTTAQTLPIVVDWIHHSSSSLLILPFLNALYQWPVNIESMVTLADNLIRSHLLSGSNHGLGLASWSLVVTESARFSEEILDQYLQESVLRHCFFCLVQQVLLALPLVSGGDLCHPWLARIVQWLDTTQNTHTALPEKPIIILVFLYLQMLLAMVATKPRPPPSLDPMIAVLINLSDCKSYSSVEFRVVCRSMAVFLQSQWPTNNLLRTMPHQPGGLQSSASTLPGQASVARRTIVSLEALKSLRHSENLSPETRMVLESALTYICDSGHSIMDAVALLRLMCGRVWPGEGLLSLVVTG